MSEWNNTNLAHVGTWRCMIEHKQLPSTTTFDVAGEKTMNALAFWSDLDSPEQRVTKANALAAEMDNFLRNVFGAEYKPGNDAASAIKSISGVLQNATKKLSDLGAQAEVCYLIKA
ncbi:MAG TPA: hypothetical protein VET48_05465 [Steroidobacteraceae bacterium]|nr:hypothetical protein [Steroidobacteraceae bacterium]